MSRLDEGLDGWFQLRIILINCPWMSNPCHIPDIFGHMIEKKVLANLCRHGANQPRHNHVILGIPDPELRAVYCWTRQLTGENVNFTFATYKHRDRLRPLEEIVAIQLDR